MDHKLHDMMSLDMARHLCRKLRENPLLLQRVQGQLDYLETIERQCKPEYRQAWIDAVGSGLEATLALALDESERGQVLRSCSPMGVLWETPEERLEWITVWKKNHKGERK